MFVQCYLALRQIAFSVQEECEELNAKLAVQRAKSRVLTQTLRILSTECLKLNELNNSIIVNLLFPALFIQLLLLILCLIKRLHWFHGSLTYKQEKEDDAYKIYLLIKQAEITETYGPDAIRNIKPIDHEVDSESDDSVELS